MPNSISSSLVIGLIDNVSKPAKSVEASLRELQRDTASIAKTLANTGASDKFIASLAKMKVGAKDVESLAQAMRDYAKSAGLAANSSEWTKAQISGFRRFENQAVSALRRVSSEQSRFVAASRRAMAAAVQRPVERLPHVPARPHGVHLPHGLGVLGAGYTTWRVGEKAIESGADLTHTRVEMAKAGISPQEIATLAAKSFELSGKYRNVSQASLLEMSKEVRSVLTDPREVMEVLEPLAAAKSLLDASDKTGAQSEGLSMLIKGAENIGAAKNPQRIVQLIDGYIKAMQVMGKTITPEQIYESLKYSKSAGALLSDRFLMTTLPSLSQEMKGNTAGLGVSGLYKQISGGMQNLHTAAQELAGIGMIDPKNLDRTKTGEIKGVKKGVRHAVVGDVKAAHDPDLWVFEDLIPHMEKAGLVSEADQLAFVRKAFPNSNVSDVVSKLIVQRQQFAAHAAMYAKATGGAGAALNAKDPSVALEGLNTQLMNLGATLTSPMMESAAGAIDAIAKSIHNLAAAAQEHPDAARPLAAGGLAALLAGGAALAGKTLGVVRGWFGGGAAGAAEGAGSGFLGTMLRGGLKWGLRVGGWVTLAQLLAEYGPDAVGDPEHPPKGDALETMRLRNNPPVDLDELRSQRDEHDRQLRILKQTRENPDGFYGPPAPHVDGSQIDGLKPKVEEGKAALESLNMTVTPNVEAGSLDSAIAKARELVGLYRQIGALAPRISPMGFAAGAGLQSLGHTARGHFTTSGVQGE
jgi:hypothetical protein